jgi:enoyl-CoA hydratase/carnithine racemase
VTTQDEESPDQASVRFERVAPYVARVTIHNERRANALTPEMSTDLARIWADIDTDSSVRVAIVTAAGSKMFSAGNDVTRTPPANDPTWSFAGLGAITRVGKPLIAAINGAAVGGGLEIALGCDIRIASDQAWFSLPEPKLGLMAGVGGTQRLPRLIGHARAMDMLLSGRRIDAATALDWGLVTRLSSPDALGADALELALEISRLGPMALRTTKRSVMEGIGLTLEAGLDNERTLTYSLRYSAESAEGRLAFREKREPNFPDH